MCSIKKGVLKNFDTGKLLCQSFFLNKVVGVEKENLAQVFSCEFRKIFKNTLFTEQRWTTASAFLIGIICINNNNNNIATYVIKALPLFCFKLLNAFSNLSKSHSTKKFFCYEMSRSLEMFFLLLETFSAKWIQ